MNESVEMTDVEIFASFAWPVAVACKRNEKELQIIGSNACIFFYRGQMNDMTNIFARVVHPLIMDELKIPLAVRDVSVQMKPMFIFLQDSMSKFMPFFQKRMQSRQMPMYLDFKSLFIMLGQNDVSLSAEKWFKTLSTVLTNLPVLTGQMPVARELFSLIVH
jgi:hypothetical protein